jgi:hypothetical protein
MTNKRISAALVVITLLAMSQLGITQEASQQGSHEGIKVHGSWTIELRNPDGSIASTHKFENALATTGGPLLVQMLAHQRSTQYWQIQITNKDGGLCNRAGNHVPCIIQDSALPAGESSVFATLTVSAPASGENAGKLVLSGTAPAAFDGAIAAVNTTVGHTCAPTECGTTWSTFTIAVPALTVQAGQTINVTVVISFS